ncbi:AfsR/SARP family transcriptional regulator [Streptosporangium lutulentum]|uniref:DNA-binding SARP family transcriptional activator n=1 Tax=Streptosporangium lutulentum TaxID=1461250 RepID=A0ABT9QRD6_9ACTN|nr:BTAD domain-containing putative transcriptional regulator [Streptosporangium lutulentum]MDP9848990.1 DNA-binding SARP family transcriptional activator [Streptosporangium lutulentum]
MGNGDRSSLHVTLLGGFRLFAGSDQMTLSGGSERLLAFTALCGQAVPRNLIAGTLWPDTSEQRAYSSLRSALARLDGVGRKILDVGATEIRLSPEVRVDLHGARALARRVLDPAVMTEEEDLSAKAVEALSGGLLPGWYDGWVLAEAEEWQQLRLHALEALTADFIMAGRFADAVSAAGVAVRAEPLRESACAALIRAHLAEGNQAEALRHFKRYERHLHEELALRPTPQLRELLAELHGALGR